MKNLLTTIAILTLLATPVFAADYTAVTKDNEVTSKQDVQVQKAQTVEQKEMLTLRYLQTQKSV